MIACEALHILGLHRPEEYRVMVDGGVMELLVSYYVDVGDNPRAKDFLNGAVKLAHVLLCTEPQAARKLREAMSGPETTHAYTAMVLFQVLLLHLLLYCSCH
jgi:hypothetical protein